MKLLPIYLSYLVIACLWFLLGVLGGWALRGGGLFSLPSWDPVETTLSNLIMLGICTIPHALVFGFILSLLSFSSYPKISLTISLLPVIYACLVAILFVYSMVRPSTPSDVVRKLYDDPHKQKIVFACFEHDQKSVEKYLASGGDLEFRDKRGFTMLMFASERCDWKTVKFLLSMGAQVNTPLDIENNRSALLFLWDQHYKHDYECLKKTSDLLVSAGAEMSAFREKLLKIVIKKPHGADFIDQYIPNLSQDEINELALTSYYHRQYDNLEAMLKRGADPHWKPNDNRSSVYENLSNHRFDREKEIFERLKKKQDI
jgi:hypothetical protein